MALSAAQKTQVFEILGIPEAQGASAYSDLTGLYGVSGEVFDLTGVYTRVSSLLGSVSSTQEARVAALLARHAAITSSSPLQVNGAAGGVRGVLVDHPAERENIRTALGNILGVAVPLGGFVAEAALKARGVGRVGR